MASQVGFIRDRFTQGTIAGAIGWAPQAVFTITLYSLHLTKLRFLDFAAVLAFNHKPNGFWDSLLAEGVVLIMQSALGGVFAWWIKQVENGNMVWKGAFFGGFAWFTIYAVTALYKLPGLYPIGASTAFVNMLSSLLYGMTMGWAYSLLYRKFGLKN